MRLREKLAGTFSPNELKMLYNSFDIVGDIAILRLPKALESRGEVIAEAVMQINKHVRTVLCQVGPVSGEHRLRELKWLLGEKKTETIHREHGCLFKVDLAKCYFSPRLLYERMRIARQVNPGEVIVNMFAGVGCFSIIIAKYSRARKIYSIDINPDAVKYMQANIVLNKVEDIIEAIEGDSKEVIISKLKGVADRVLMPLPEKAYEYLDYALMALKSAGGIIHYYDFEHAGKNEDPVAKVAEKVSRKLLSMKVNFNVTFARIVRTVGPRWYQIVLDIFITGKD
ncbi:MAG: class I SAM-dependent methyltransferase family protein [Candidatus Bathyarchaeia archaeon]|nr:class I SAM-dependent methyltransferase family protein [Candidatus Bathyarchaeota archaeon]